MIAATTPLQLGGQNPNVEQTPLVTTILDAFKSMSTGSDGYVWMGDILSYIRIELPKVSARTLGKESAHTPLVVAIGNDFPIAWHNPSITPSPKGKSPAHVH